MKKILAPIFLAGAQSLFAQTYTITNDLATTFSVFSWTNNGAGIVITTNAVLLPNTATNLIGYTNGAAGYGVQATNAYAALYLPWSSAPTNSDSVSDLVAQALAIAEPPGETVPQAQSVLKSYFLTGEIPSQANYWELIDSMFWYVNQTYASAQAAANSAAASANSFWANATLSLAAATTNITATVLYGNNITNVTFKQTAVHINVVGTTWVYEYKVTANFINNLTGTNYNMLLSMPDQTPTTATSYNSLPLDGTGTQIGYGLYSNWLSTANTTLTNFAWTIWIINHPYNMAGKTWKITAQ